MYTFLDEIESGDNTVGNFCVTKNNSEKIKTIYHGIKEFSSLEGERNHTPQQNFIFILKNTFSKLFTKKFIDNTKVICYS